MSERERIDLLSNASASSDGTHQAKVGGTYMWSLEGTFNGGSYQLQMGNANGTFTDIPGKSMSAAGFMEVDLPPGVLVKAVETGTTSAMYSTLVLMPSAVGSSDAEVVGGLSADDAAAAGNPVPVGGIYNTTLPTYSNLDRTQIQTGSRGSVHATLMAPSSASPITGAIPGDAGGVQPRLYVASLLQLWNGTSEDRARPNTDITVFSSTARTATPTPFDGTNYNGRGLHLVIDCTAVAATPSVVFTIQALDVISGKYYTVLASAAITGTGTTVLRVYPGLTAAANLVASDILPRSWRVIATHADSDSITYSVGASVIL